MNAHAAKPHGRCDARVGSGSQVVRRAKRLCAGGLAALLAAGCATLAPEPGQVISMRSEEGAAREGFPPAGTVWRLDEQELRALGPIVRAPDPPPAPRRDARREIRVVPSFIYYGSHDRFGFGLGTGWPDPFFWPRYYPFPYHYGPYGHPWYRR